MILSPHSQTSIRRLLIACGVILSLAACSPVAASPVPVTATTPPAPSPTPTAPPIPFTYAIEKIEGQAWLGIGTLYITTSNLPPRLPAVAPTDLRLPAPTLRPAKGRFLDIRGNAAQLVHLGTDWVNPINDPLIAPTPDSMLALAVHLQPDKFLSIALDMSGDIQMHLIRVSMPDGEREILYCYAHLEAGSNDQAIKEARADNGHAETVGRISRISPASQDLSDMHMAAIDVKALLSLTGADDLPTALRLLFSGNVPRTDQQYASIFIRPEDVMAALEPLLIYDPGK
jgi:hypothetical protein